MTTGGRQRWSYSRLATYEQCPMCYRLSYTDQAPQTNNAFAEYGTLCHSLLERYNNGDFIFGDIAEQYRAEYDGAVTHAFPPYPKGMGAKYYEQGLDYFSTLEGLPAGGHPYTVLMNEERFEMDMDGLPMTGIIDVLLRDDETGELILMDHKSKSLRTIQKERRQIFRQLYLYAVYVETKYGLPDLLSINALREKTDVTIPFDPAELERTLSWLHETAAKVQREEAWPHKEKPDYFCTFLCSVYNHCPLMGY